MSNGAEGDNFAGGDVGALPPAGNPAWVIGVNRDTAGRTSSLTYPGGGTRTLTYAPDGRQAPDTVRNQASVVTASVAYEYNCVGELDYETVTLPGNAGTGTNAYRYDAAGRLNRWDPGAATAPEQCPTLAAPAAVTGVGDNFNRANSTALGAAWLERVPTSGAAATALTIAGNELTNPGTTWLAAVHTTVATTDRQAAEVKVKNLSSTAFSGPAVRLSANGNQGYAALARSGTNEVRLYKINNAMTVLVTKTLSSSPEGKTIRIEADGSTLRVLVDGVVEITHTDTSYTGTTYRRVGVVSNGAEADNFYGGDKTVAYTYDKAGNRTKAWAESFTYDTRNRLATDGTGSYTWNAVGSLGSYAQPGSPTETYTFDAGGRMTLVTDGAVSSAFGYDGLDRVTARNGTAFTYSGASTDPVSVGSESFTWAAGGLVTVTASGALTFPLVDRHGDLIARFGADGTVSGSASFDPYGEPTGTTGTSSVLGFQSDYTDPSTGHVWMAARWYQPSSATFLSRDTYAGEVKTPFTLNRYTYGVNNPVRFWDPTGRSWEYVPEVYDDCYTMACRDLLDKQISSGKAPPPEEQRPMDLDAPWINDYIDRMMKDKKFVEDSYHRIQTDKIFSWAETQVNPTIKDIAAEDFTKLQEEHQHHH